MVQKVLTKKTFIGGSLHYPGDLVDVDAKGTILPAGSTPIANMTVDQLRSVLAAREAEEKAPDFGSNLADPTEDNTGAQPFASAAVAPHAPDAVNPQTLPPGSVPVGGTFLRPAPDSAPAAREEIVANTPEQIEGVNTQGSLVADLTGGNAGANSGFDPEEAITGNVDDVRGQIDTLAAADLDRLEAAENDREKPRKGVLDAIAARRQALNDEA